MIELKYSLVIEATEDPNFFGFYSPDLHGFTGIGNSVEDCLYKAKWGMQDFIGEIKKLGLEIPKPSRRPKVTIVNTPATRSRRRMSTANRTVKSGAGEAA